MILTLFYVANTLMFCRLNDSCRELLGRLKTYLLSNLMTFSSYLLLFLFSVIIIVQLFVVLISYLCENKFKFTMEGRN